VDEVVIAGAEELELGDIEPLRGPAGALKDPDTTGVVSEEIRVVGAELVLSKLKGTEGTEPDAVVAEEPCPSDRLPLVSLNGNPPDAAEELA
jgi:hypothetical protein